VFITGNLAVRLRVYVLAHLSVSYVYSTAFVCLGMFCLFACMTYSLG